MNTTMRTLGQLVAALMVGVALTGVLAGGVAADRKTPDHGSKSAFQLDCEIAGGLYAFDDLGNTFCFNVDGSWTECDANGNDCWYTPRAAKPGLDVHGAGQATGSGGELAPKPNQPVVDPAPPVNNQPVAHQTTHKHDKNHGKQHGHVHGGAKSAHR